eukprot:764303-Hanusia_phi.AAC.1
MKSETEVHCKIPSVAKPGWNSLNLADARKRSRSNTVKLLLYEQYEVLQVIPTIFEAWTPTHITVYGKEFDPVVQPLCILSNSINDQWEFASRFVSTQVILCQIHVKLKEGKYSLALAVNRLITSNLVAIEISPEILITDAAISSLSNKHAFIVNIYGLHFQRDMHRCVFGWNRPSTLTTMYSSSHIKCSTPTMHNSNVTVSLEIVGRGTTKPCKKLLHFQNNARIIFIVPSQAFAGGTTMIVAAVKNLLLDDKLICHFGNTSTYGTFIHLNEIRCLSPSHTKPGIVPFTLNIFRQNLSLTARGTFFFETILAPIIQKIIPSSGPLHGGTKVQVIGNHMGANFKLKCCFDRFESSLQTISATLAVCLSPAAQLHQVLTFSLSDDCKYGHSISETLKFEFLDDFELLSVFPSRVFHHQSIQLTVLGIAFPILSNLRCAYTSGKYLDLHRATLLSSTKLLCDAPMRFERENVQLEIAGKLLPSRAQVLDLQIVKSTEQVASNSPLMHSFSDSYIHDIVIYPPYLLLDSMSIISVHGKNFESDFSCKIGGGSLVKSIFVSSMVILCHVWKSGADQSTLSLTTGVGDIIAKSEITVLRAPKTLYVTPTLVKEYEYAMITIQGDSFPMVETNCQFGNGSVEAIQINSTTLICPLLFGGAGNEYVTLHLVPANLKFKLAVLVIAIPDLYSLIPSIDTPSTKHLTIVGNKFPDLFLECCFGAWKTKATIVSSSILVCRSPQMRSYISLQVNIVISGNVPIYGSLLQYEYFDPACIFKLKPHSIHYPFKHMVTIIGNDIPNIDLKVKFSDSELRYSKFVSSSILLIDSPRSVFNKLDLFVSVDGLDWMIANVTLSCLQPPSISKMIPTFVTGDVKSLTLFGVNFQMSLPAFVELGAKKVLGIFVTTTSLMVPTLQLASGNYTVQLASLTSLGSLLRKFQLVVQRQEDPFTMVSSCRTSQHGQTSPYHKNGESGIFDVPRLVFGNQTVPKSQNVSETKTNVVDADQNFPFEYKHMVVKRALISPSVGPVQGMTAIQILFPSIHNSSMFMCIFDKLLYGRMIQNTDNIKKIYCIAPPFRTKKVLIQLFSDLTCEVFEAEYLYLHPPEIKSVHFQNANRFNIELNYSFDEILSWTVRLGDKIRVPIMCLDKQTLSMTAPQIHPGNHSVRVSYNDQQYSMKPFSLYIPESISLFKVIPSSGSYSAKVRVHFKLNEQLDKRNLFCHFGSSKGHISTVFVEYGLSGKEYSCKVPPLNVRQSVLFLCDLNCQLQSNPVRFEFKAESIHHQPLLLIPNLVQLFRPTTITVRGSNFEHVTTRLLSRSGNHTPLQAKLLSTSEAIFKFTPKQSNAQIEIVVNNAYTANLPLLVSRIPSFLTVQTSISIEPSASMTVSGRYLETFVQGYCILASVYKTKITYITDNGSKLSCPLPEIQYARNLSLQLQTESKETMDTGLVLQYGTTEVLIIVTPSTGP